MQSIVGRAAGEALFSGALLCGLFLAAWGVRAQAQSVGSTQTAPAADASLSTTPGAVAAASPRLAGASSPMVRRATPMSAHARDHYQLLWGVDSLDVKAVESGQMIRFSYFVLDAAKATPLNDKKANPLLIDEQARVKLEIPTMEKVGQLRQSSPPEAGRQYWMVFSNKGSVVKPGDRVSVVIGKFRADGLYVR